MGEVTMMYRWAINNTTIMDLSACTYQTLSGLFPVELHPIDFYNDTPVWERLL